MRTAIVLIVLAAAAVAIGAGVAMTMNNGGEEPQPFYTDYSADNHVNSLAWNILDHSENGNVVFSPYSLYTALGMLLNGAKEDSATEKELADLLGVGDADAVNAFISKVIQDMPASDEYLSLEAANLVLLDKSVLDEPGVRFNETFAEILEKIYNGTADTADFANDLAAAKEYIRKWVDVNTDGMIPDYKSIATDQTVTDILNTIYLKASWEQAFSKDSTRTAVFHKEDGKDSKIDMMNRMFGHVRYYTDGKFRGVEIPYITTGDEGLAMYIVLPADPADRSVRSEWSKQTVEYRESFMENVRKADYAAVNVSLPRFEAEASFDLCEMLESLGLSICMSDSAEFTQILDNQMLHVGIGKHQAKIKVDEKGTEAAAVTEISMEKNASVLAPDVVRFCCDIPFIYAVSSMTDGTDVFVGYVGSL